MNSHCVCEKKSLLLATIWQTAEMCSLFAVHIKYNIWAWLASSFSLIVFNHEVNAGFAGEKPFYHPPDRTSADVCSAAGRQWDSEVHSVVTVSVLQDRVALHHSEVH